MVSPVPHRAGRGLYPDGVQTSEGAPSWLTRRLALVLSLVVLALVAWGLVAGPSTPSYEVDPSTGNGGHHDIELYQEIANRVAAGGNYYQVALPLQNEWNFPTSPVATVREPLEAWTVAAIADRKVGKCSGGDQQRLRFAMALLSDPELLILDDPTASLSTTAALALSVFVAVPLFGIEEQGMGGYLKSYVEPTVIMLPFNIISELSRTLALAVRLFGNMMSGTMILAILLTITPFIFPIAMSALGLLTGMVQAYIFSILAAVYIAAATRGRKSRSEPTQHI